MAQDSRTVTTSAVVAFLLVVIVLVFITISPWMLLGVPAVLWAIAGIVRAVNGSVTAGPGSGHDDLVAPSRHELPGGPAHEPESTAVDDRLDKDT